MPTTMAETVSCVIPARNAAVHIRAAVESVLAQTHPAAEILVVDDGSDDETAATARATDGRVTVISQAGLGPAAARNRGILAAQGSHIAFLDADDTWHPEKLERQTDHLRDHPEAGMCFCQVETVWIEDEGIQSEPTPSPSPVQPTTLLVRREVFEDVGLFDPSLRYTDALEWLIRARRAGVGMETVPERLYRRRMHGRNMSVMESAAARSELLALVRRLPREMGSSG